MKESSSSLFSQAAGNCVASALTAASSASTAVAISKAANVTPEDRYETCLTLYDMFNPLWTKFFFLSFFGT